MNEDEVNNNRILWCDKCGRVVEASHNGAVLMTGDPNCKGTMRFGTETERYLELQNRRESEA